MRLQTFISACLILLGAPVFSRLANAAAPDVKFGPEFTFDNSEADVNLYKLRLKAHLIDGQPIGEKFTKPAIKDERFQSPNGWWLLPDTDIGVIEVAMKPMTAANWKLYRDDIQDAVFVTAYNANAFPALYLGGGHINVDLKELYKDPLLLRNFIVDYWNHNELAMGAWNYDSHNAGSFWLMEEVDRLTVIQMIESFDRNLLKGTKFSRRRVKRWLDRLNRTLLNGSPILGHYWRSSNNGKNTDLSFTHVATENRIEIRAVRPQPDVHTWIHQISLIQGRLNYLSKLKEPIPLKMRVPLTPLEEPGQVEKAALVPPINPKLALQSFYEYVKESGERWENHRAYIWPQWKSRGHLTRFEKSEWFRSREQNCGGFL